MDTLFSDIGLSLFSLEIVVNNLVLRIQPAHLFYSRLSQDYLQLRLLSSTSTLV